MRSHPPKRASAFKFPILHKGLAVILLPLALQIFCAYKLAGLVDKAEKLSAADIRQAKLIAWADDLMMDFASRFGECLQLLNPVGERTLNPDEFLTSMKARFADGERLANEDPEMTDAFRGVLKECKKVIASEYLLAKRVSKLPTSSGSFVSQITTITEIKPLLVQLGPQVNNTRQQLLMEREKLQRVREQEESAIRQIKRQVLLIVGADVFLTITLLAFFLNNVTRRLSILVNNAQLIPSNEPLTQTVSGGDELAYLDTVLHSASQSIAEATEYRKSLMQMVAHDLRSPLVAADLAVQGLTMETSSISTVGLKDRLDVVHRNLKRLIRFVEDLLTIDKLEAGKLELQFDIVDTRQVVSEAFEGVAAIAQEKGIKLVNEVPSTTTPADKHRLIQVLANLVSNAIKYSPRDSSIIVGAETAPRAIKYLVSDNGPGISLEQQAKLFQKFYQADQETASKGFGLGLAICRLIIEEHGGTIGVISEPGQGSTFWFTIPLDEESAEPSAD
jgi:signal transduction histidine kinase